MPVIFEQPVYIFENQSTKYLESRGKTTISPQKIRFVWRMIPEVGGDQGKFYTHLLSGMVQQFPSQGCFFRHRPVLVLFLHVPGIVRHQALLQCTTPYTWIISNSKPRNQSYESSSKYLTSTRQYRSFECCQQLFRRFWDPCTLSRLC